MPAKRDSLSSSRYDVIIVGGGTAGCVLAAQLSSGAPHLQFLLLEAGPNNNDDPNVRTPLTGRRMFGHEKYDWCFKSLVQPGLSGREISQTRGKMLGGSSAINSHSLVYPNREMHDAWARLVGDQNWAWERMEMYYKRFEESSSENGETRSSGGALKVSFPSQLNRLQQAWVEAFKEINAAAINPSRGQAIGGMTTTNAIDGRPGRGERSHAGNAYLEPAMSLPNLTVRTGSLVEKIALSKGSVVRAEGVYYANGSEQCFAEATKEVILCAGVFGSPQLLELSGIGQRAVLAAAGVEQVLELAGTGENLQDHLNYGPSVEVRPDIETIDFSDYDSLIRAQQEQQYHESKTGPLAEGAAYSFAYWPLQLLNSEEDENWMQGAIEAHRAKHPLSHQNEYIYQTLLSPSAASATVFMTRKARYTRTASAADGKYMSIIAMLSHPFSRGSTHIRSASAADPPLIDPQYLRDELDTEILARHVLQIEKFLQLSTFEDVLVPNGRHHPTAFSWPPESVEEVKEAIRQHGATNYHPCGSCAMMSLTARGVLDGSLRVYGTQNLRICDASIFPIIPRGNILTTVYAVAEKAVDIFLQEWGGQAE